MHLFDLCVTNLACYVQDLLPNLPDFSEIEVFKEVICSTLEDAGGMLCALAYHFAGINIYSYIISFQ